MIRKGTSALDYLVTYGWAVMAILIVGALLWQFGIFDSARLNATYERLSVCSNETTFANNLVVPKSSIIRLNPTGALTGCLNQSCVTAALTSGEQALLESGGYWCVPLCKLDCETTTVDYKK